MDPQFQTVELYGPSDPETGVKSAMDSQVVSGSSPEGVAKPVRASVSGHVKRSAGMDLIALLRFQCDRSAGFSSVARQANSLVYRVRLRGFVCAESNNQVSCV